ncbi:nucleoside phosphorylase [Candidatus Borrarchaeum sp.]|uniref:nucleoside phosphorylase n=1 Tax=Candidatus Borrarchaeum sp. TaxID=2846742 RepID=UPI00257DADE8|nr:nucleoside phosphorylase [Candidatus Borrarchaeum sp.]
MSFPNLKNKHKEAALLTPQKYLDYLKKRGKYPDYKPPKGVILLFQKELLEYIIKNHEIVKVRGFHGDFYLLKETDNRIGVLGNFGWGAPVVVILLEQLIAFGVKEFISVGIAGSLQKDLRVGNIIICDKAIRDEGVSHHYIKSSKYSFASKTLTKKIEEALTRFNLEYSVGTTWTIDTPYRETITEVKQYQKEGVLTVDMEASAIFSVAEYRGVEAGSIFTISDYLAELEWELKFHLTKDHLETLFQVAKEVLLDS